MTEVQASILVGFLTAVLAVLALTARPAPAADEAPAGKAEENRPKPIPVAKVERTTPVDFEKEILPALSTSCLACHNKTKAKASLVLETPADIRKGGENGPAAVPGKSSESLMLKAAAHQVESSMPPAENKVAAPNLTPDQLGLLALWIDQGAAGEVRGVAAINWQAVPETLQPVYAVAVSPDGQLAACGRGNGIVIYDLPAGRLVARLADPGLSSEATGGSPRGAAHRDLVQSLAFSPDGKLLASGGYREVKLWRRPDPAKKYDLGAAGAVIATASPDGKLLATAEADGTIRLWDAATGKPAGELPGHSGAVTALRFSHDGSRLASAADDQTLRVWDVAGRKPYAKANSQVDVKTDPKKDAKKDEEADAKTYSAKADAAKPVRAIAWLGNSRLATAGGETVIRLWKLPDSANGEMTPVKELKAHDKPVTALDSVATSPPQLLSGGEDGKLILWNVETAKPTRQAAHGSAVVSVAARSDGKRLASLGADGTARLWDTEGKAEIKKLADLKGDRETGRKLQQAERMLALATADLAFRKTRLQDIEKEEKAAADGVAKAKDALAAAEKDLDAKQSALPKPADKPDEEKKDADKKDAKDARKPDVGKKESDAEKELKKAEVAKASAEDQVKQSEKAANEAKQAVANAREVIKAAEADLKAREAEAAAAKQAAAIPPRPARLLAFSPDGGTVATAGEDGTLRTWSGQDGGPLLVLQGWIEEPPESRGVSPRAGRRPVPTAKSLVFAGGDALLVLPPDGPAAAWDLAGNWKLERTLGGAPGTAGTSTEGTSASTVPLSDRVNALGFTPDGRQLVTGGGVPSRTGEIRVWDVATGKLERALDDIHSDTVLSLQVSPDGKRLLTGSADKFVRVTDLSTGKVLRSLEGHSHHVLGVAWKSDARTAASAGADNTLRFWDTETGDRKKPVQGFDKEVTSVCFVGDTDAALAGSGEGKVRLIKESGTDVRSFSGETDFVYAVAATPDGKTVLAGGQDGMLRVWNAADGKVVATLGDEKK